MSAKPSEPTTREEALSRADDWANGALSHWNEFNDHAVATGDSHGSRGWREARIADLLQANRYTALAALLPTAAEAELAEGLPSAPGPEYQQPLSDTHAELHIEGDRKLQEEMGAIHAREAAEAQAATLAGALAAVLLDGPYVHKGPLRQAREALTAWTRFENNRGRDAPEIVGKALLAVIGAVGQD